MKACDYVAKFIEKRGVTHVFELVGGMITFLIDSIAQTTRIKIVSMHHEQGAGFAAEGFARSTGLPGVAMATSGPGATNLLTAIGSCYFDSVATVFITGQVNRSEQKGERAIRQLGFQETDIVSMARPITKAAWLVNDPDELPNLLERAFALASEGRPGPVLLDIPMDVQRAEVQKKADAYLPRGASSTSDIEPDEFSPFVSQLSKSLGVSKRPLILAGGGINAGHARSVFRQLVEKIGLPVAHSLMAVDVLHSNHPLRVGLIGSYGNRWANTILSECDFLLVLGSRLDVRQTGAETESFRSNRVIYHVDCEPGELNNRITGCVSLVSDLAGFCARALSVLPRCPVNSSWTERINDLKRQWPDTEELKNVDGVNPNVFLQKLSRCSHAAAAFFSDVGQHQMWSAQSLELTPGQRFMTSGGMGAMGFALPAGIGAALGLQMPVVVVAGDGGFQINIQELQTIVRNQIPVKMVVINNQCHGMVRQFQDSYFEGRLQSTLWGYSAPSFRKLSMAYGIDSRTVAADAEIDAGLEALWKKPDKPFLLEVMIPTELNAYPKMAFGKPMSEMEPFSKPLDMEAT